MQLNAFSSELLARSSFLLEAQCLNQQVKNLQGQLAELEKDREEVVSAIVETLVCTESLEIVLKEEQEKGKRTEDEYQLRKASSETRVKHLEKQL